MSAYITQNRVIPLQDVETLTWLSARFRKKIRAAVSASERRLCKRALQALNRHLTILSQRLLGSGSRVERPTSTTNPKGKGRKGI